LWNRLVLKNRREGKTPYPLPFRDWLRCRPQGAALNLIRKELRLQKPLFLIAVVFALCWFVALGLWFIQPATHELFETVLTVLAVFYAPLIALLAGCVSLGEEKALGLTAWHLTLPVSAWKQWLAKLGVSSAIWLALGL